MRGNLDPQGWGITPSDVAHIRARGSDIAEVRRQLAVLSGRRPITRLIRPCTVGDGIEAVPEHQRDALIGLAVEEARRGSLMKFVPASGAATRMFRLQMQVLTGDAAATGTPEWEDFWAHLLSMPFSGTLRDAMRNVGHDLETCVVERRYREVLRYLLGTDGLNYAHLPKALLPFHRYDGTARTALEEHFVEAIDYLRDARRTCRLHFTVSPVHADRFRSAVNAARSLWGKRYRVQYDIRTSTQKASTDTVALDGDGRPFRTENGRLLFRAGGHGALLENLGELGGDVVFIGNIDNVVPDWRRLPRVRWAQILGGYLLRLQRMVFDYMERLTRSDPEPKHIRESVEFARATFGREPPASWSSESWSQRCGGMIAVLNRPIRVCGMVKNRGEPGGGPFWVKMADGISRQIVESAEVAMDDAGQRSVFESASHFNPVNIVCGLCDHKGARFHLADFVDWNACFVSHKTYRSKPLKALELPGLWNGGMAHWLTVFVEVPGFTFTPAKTVMDLLRPEHQPPAASAGAEGQRY